jgi:transcriptional regulator with XRE-family HTH domain
LRIQCNPYCVNGLRENTEIQCAENAVFLAIFANVMLEGDMRETDREKNMRAMDEALLGFRMARTGKLEGTGWLRAVRQAVRVPVKKMAERLGVTEWEVYRLEKAEMDSRIMLETLRKSAAGLDCDLVYALVPRHGTLAEMAAKSQLAREEARKEKRELAREKKEAELKPWLQEIGWHGAMQNYLRVLLRRDGVRIRPRKTERGDAKTKEVFEAAMELVKLGGKVGLGTRE